MILGANRNNDVGQAVDGTSDSTSQSTIPFGSIPDQMRYVIARVYELKTSCVANPNQFFCKDVDEALNFRPGVQQQSNQDQNPSMNRNQQ
ncbi:hypothetical protein WR25_23573 [Diploscapter pachys]|uniref:Uncharacterized protein n=1 Tax=Diploscapter pachys TaxID=2018661 RepID=A0A2A2JFG2_9BILA|nr:hypothetical protein WR25_23573 [Diploscapter pachys]